MTIREDREKRKNLFGIVENLGHNILLIHATYPTLQQAEENLRAVKLFAKGEVLILKRTD